MKQTAETVLAQKLPKSGFYISGIIRLTNGMKKTTGWLATVRLTSNNYLVGRIHLDTNGKFVSAEALPV